MQFTTDIVSLLVSEFLRNSTDHGKPSMLNLHRERGSPFLHVNNLHHSTPSWCLIDYQRQVIDNIVKF